MTVIYTHQEQGKRKKEEKRREEKMYVTRPLSWYRREPSALTVASPEGPNSGVLVIQDEEAESTCFFGLIKSDQIKSLPFPQNKNLSVRYTQDKDVSINHVLFIPVLNQPLSSNLYYVVERKGKHKGKTHMNSKEEDMTTCCFFNCISDSKPQPLDPRSIYQQFEIRSRYSGCFVAKSVAPDGFPPQFLRRKGWRLHTSTPKEFQLSEAAGVDRTLRARLPDLNFSSAKENSPSLVVGKWYCPFMFIKEGGEVVKEQMTNSTYYEMILEQQWQHIFSCEENKSNEVNVDVDVSIEVVRIGREQVVASGKNLVDGVVRFRSTSFLGGEGTSVGLSLEIVEKMRWEEERFGWVYGESGEREVKVKRVEEFGGKGEWKRLDCYVLVERFVLKRMDGSLVLTYEFKHPHLFRSEWE